MKNCKSAGSAPEGSAKSQELSDKNLDEMLRSMNDETPKGFSTAEEMLAKIKAHPKKKR